MTEFLYKLTTIKIGSIYLSGIGNLNMKLWNKGYTVRVFLKYFLLYTK